MPCDETYFYYASGALYAKISSDAREFFYETGRPKTIEKYVEGRLEGEVLLYWPNGRLKRRCLFRKGVRYGLDQMWDESGNLVDEEHYDL